VIASLERAGAAWPRADEVARYLASKPMPAAVVVDVGWVNGLAAIRSLGRAGAPVLALDHRRGALGFRSRYCLPLLCPDPGADEEGFVAFLAHVASALDRPAPIFPTHDEQLRAVARNLDAFAGRLLLPAPPWEALARIQSKRFQLERAQEAGVPIPATAYPVRAAEALAAARELGYPVLVKPSEPTGFKRAFRRQAFRCASEAELERAFAAAEPFAPMVQEEIPGGDGALWTLGSYLAQDGEALGVFTGRKLRQTPPGIGTCRVGEASWNEEVAELGLRLLRALRFHGISQVELKRDPRDMRYKLMEVNPRLWQWHGLAAACGVDLPRLAYWDLLGARLPPARMRGNGRRWAITLLRGEGPAFQRPPYVDAVVAADDPVPALVQGARLLRGARR
jgi:predicted ATP-grasp superfamily ATP-dependent carboligase